MTADIMKVLSIRNVAAGQTATMQLSTDSGLAYLNTILHISNNGIPSTEAELRAHVEWVRIRIDGNIVREMTAGEILDLHQLYNKHRIVDGMLPLYFQEPWAAEKLSREIFRLGTANLSRILIEVKFASTATNPTLVANAAAVVAPKETLGHFKRFMPRTVHYSGDGTLNINDLPKNQGNIAALHLQTANIVGVQVKTGNVLRIDTQRNQEHARIEALNKKAPQAGYTHIDFNDHGQIDGFIDVSKGVDLNLDMSGTGGAGSFRLLAETVIKPKAA